MLHPKDEQQFTTFADSSSSKRDHYTSIITGKVVMVFLIVNIILLLVGPMLCMVCKRMTS